MKYPVQSLFLFFLSLISFLSFAVLPVSAQSPNSYSAPSTNPDVPKNLHNWTQNVMLEVGSAMTCQLVGIDPINPKQKCIGVDQKTGSIGFVENGGGAIGVVNNMIAMLYTPPIHTSDYIAYLGQNFGIVKPAYAANQGGGFGGLFPLIGLWSTFRNIVYLLFVIVFIIIGVAIMLRIHIDPRTVMTIENQIPKIIVGLLMVTFSFAIAGFLIDMMYVSIYVAYNTIVQAPGVSQATKDQFNPSRIQDKNILEVLDPIQIGALAGKTAYSTTGLIQNMMDIAPTPFNVTLGPLLTIANIGDLLLHLIPGVSPDFLKPDLRPFDTLINILSGSAAAAWAIHVLTLPVPAVAGTDVGWLENAPLLVVVPVINSTVQLLLRVFLPYLLVFLIVFIALLWALVRLWLELLKAYIFILLDVVLAPFWFMGGLFPGSSIGFGAWFRDLIANLSAFPVAITMFLLGKVFIDSFSTNSGSMFLPPLIGNPNGTSNDSSPIGTIIGIGIILLTPQVVTMMRDFLKAPQFKYTAAIGQAVGVGAAGPARVIGGAGQIGFGTRYEIGRGGTWQETGPLKRFLQGFGFVR